MNETGTAARAWMNPTETEQRAETQILRPSFRLISGLENTAAVMRPEDRVGFIDGMLYTAKLIGIISLIHNGFSHFILPLWLHKYSI